MAEQKLLKLTIARVDGPLFDGEVVSVNLPGVEGDMTVLADHEALISPLRAGTITLQKTDGTNESHEIIAGTLEISDNHATILV